MSGQGGPQQQGQRQEQHIPLTPLTGTHQHSSGPNARSGVNGQASIQPLSQSSEYNAYPSTHQGAYASGNGGSGRAIPGQVHHETPYDNPTNLLQVMPFVTYQPVARSAMHFAPFTETFPPAASTTALYPQHAEFFRQLDSPVTPEDWAMRDAADSRIRAAMASGQSYAANYRAPDSSSFDQPYFPPYHPIDMPAPLAYNYLPSYIPPPIPQQPPTPSSNADPQIPTGLELFDTFLASTLRAQPPSSPPDDESDAAGPARTASSHPPSSVSSTPSIARHFSRTNLQTASPGPSPSKKLRTNGQKSGSPTPRAKTAPNKESFRIVPKPVSQSQPLAQTPSSSLTSLGSSHSSGKKMVVEVEIPMRGKKAQNDEEEEEDDLMWEDDEHKDGDWDMEQDGQGSPVRAHRPILPGSGRTGDRDRRSHLERLQQLMEDIFEESDSFSAEPTDQDISSSKYFDAIHPSSIYPLLADKAIVKLNTYTNRVQKSMSRSSGESIDWDGMGLPKMLRLLERSMTGLDALSPFEDDKKAVVPKAAKAKKAKKDKKGSKSPETDPVDLKDEDVESAELTAEEVLQGENVLSAYRRAGVAAECCFTLLDTDGLSKHLLSEDLLSMAVGIVKDSIAQVLIPIVEALGGGKINSRFLQHMVDLEISARKKLGPAFASPSLSSISQTSASSLPRISSLLARSDISFGDDLIIQTVYLALTPLFVSEHGTIKKRGKEVAKAGSGVIKSLRVEALGCLRGVFARYEDQRQWIVEEILSAMGRSADSTSVARFQLPNGSHIQTISALLLQLIQASAFGVSKRIRKIRSTLSAYASESQSTVATPGAPADAEKLENLDEEMRICAESIESAIKSAGIVVKYLVQRSGSSKGNKSSHDTDYKAILDTFVNDLLTVLYRPEWPGASIYLTVLSRVLVSALEEPKSGESSAKSLALDHLGEIAAKLRGHQLNTATTSSSVSLDEIISNANVDGCDGLAQKHQVVHDFLTNAARDDGMYGCSLDMSTLVWAQELHAAIKKSSSVVEKLAQEKDAEAVETRERLDAITTKLRKILEKVWMVEDNLFDVSAPTTSTDASAASLVIARGRPLQSAFGPILSSLVATMGSTLIALRSKALRGLGTIVTTDPDVLANPSVRQAIDERLSDPSPQVRDAAVELVGKYVVQKPALAADYYPLLALRVSDSGLAVRKRVIKLLKGIFGTTSERVIKVDICCKMIGLTADTDENIKELAIRTATEMLFPPGADKAIKDSAAALFVDVVAEFQGGVAVLEAGITDVARECEKMGMESRLGEDVDLMFEKLSDAMERIDIDPLSHVRAIHLLVIARADLIDVRKAEGLLLYLKSRPLNADDKAMNEILLKIFKRCIPAMPRVASNFAVKLSEELVPMISSPAGGYPTLKETVACFCAVANHLTRDYTSVLKVLTSCEAQVRKMRNQWLTTGKATLAHSPTCGVLLYVCASIAEGCDLDKIAETDAVVRAGVEKISSEQPLYQHLFNAFLDFTRMPILQQSPSLCLGSLFRAYPILILDEQAINWMDGVFKGNDEATQARLLSVIHEFLVSEAEKKSVRAGSGGKANGNGIGNRGVKGEREDGRGMDALIGSAAELSESGLSTAVVQRNIRHILDGAKSQHVPTQSAAMEIMAFTVNQGLYHPIECVSILISLETSENERVAERALELHQTLHNKHSTLVNVRFLEHTRSSYEYQRSITAEVNGHRDGVALLQGWYTLLSEKRSWRNDFLKQLCRIFDYDISRNTVPDVGLVLYICDNLTTLEYRLQEEVMTVVGALVGCLGGMAGLVMVLEGADVEGSGEEEVRGKKVKGAEVGESYAAEVVIHASIVVGLALLTKNYLVDVFGVPEDKCVKHVPGKKSAFGDKPAVRRREGLLDTSRMAFARGVRTVEEYKTQRAAFLEMIHEDGTLDDLL